MGDSALAIERRGLRRLALVLDYAALTKPRISAMVLIVVAVAALVGSGGQCTGWPMVHALLGTLMVAASASAMNQWLERRRDALMQRTAGRPLPAGRLSPLHVTAFSLVTLLAGTLYLTYLVNLPAAAWAAATWLLYVAIYTPVKPWTAQNTAIGAVSGALPVFIGWSAVNGSWNVATAPGGLVLFLVLLLWQFPHFMAIAWMYRRQYQRAGLKMMTVVEPTGRWAGWHAVVAAALLLPVSWSLTWSAPWHESLLYLSIASVLGLIQLRFAIRFLKSRTDQTARSLLRVTLLYLPLLLLAIVFHTV